MERPLEAVRSGSTTDPPTKRAVCAASPRPHSVYRRDHKRDAPTEAMRVFEDMRLNGAECVLSHLDFRAPAGLPVSELTTAVVS
jgi:hypothetical protein